MKDKLPDDNSNDNLEEVQDYLDMLLTQATERPEARVTHIPERGERSQADTRAYQGAMGKAAPSLTMVTGRLASSQPKPAPVAEKPFAEPPKTLAFKVPVSTVMPQVEPVVVDKTGDKTSDKTVVSEQVTAPEVPEITAGTTEPVVTEPVVTESVPQAADSDTGSAVATEGEAEAIATTEWLENGRPSWAQQRFECLLFSVGGLTLAVPLVELGTIYPVSDELTPIFGQIDWFMGLLPVKDMNIRTVNTGKVVMPERYSDAMKDQIRYVISISNMDWGLAVDSVSNAITLDPEEVRWRSQRSKRPWLAGTIVEHMCALLDVSQLAAMFVQQDS